MGWGPWSELATLRAENSSLKRKLREAVQEIGHQRTVARVFNDNNGKLQREIYLADCALAAAKAKMANMHGRDPVTGRLLPRGK